MSGNHDSVNLKGDDTPDPKPNAPKQAKKPTQPKKGKAAAQTSTPQPAATPSNQQPASQQPAVQLPTRRVVIDLTEDSGSKNNPVDLTGDDGA